MTRKSPTDAELKPAYEYYVIVNPTLLREGGDSFFIYYGTKYYVSDIREYRRRQSELGTQPNPVRIPRF